MSALGVTLTQKWALTAVEKVAKNKMDDLANRVKTIGFHTTHDNIRDCWDGSRLLLQSSARARFTPSGALFLSLKTKYICQNERGGFHSHLNLGSSQRGTRSVKYYEI